MKNWDPDDYRQTVNQTPIEDFQGLSPAQMHHFLYYPFESPELVSFPEELDQNPDSPVLTLFRLLAEEIPDRGLKPTATGNLPRNLCREIALKYLGEDGYRDLTLFGGINTELDYEELNVVRIVSGQARLIRKYKRKFIVSRECRGFLRADRLDLIYTRLLKAYVGKFNWAYRDPYLDCDIIQQAFLFSLYLLMTFGDQSLQQRFYEDCFLRAFPMASAGEVPNPYASAEETFRVSYTVRTLINFMKFFGLVEARPLVTDRTFGQDYEVKKLPLLEKVIHFYLV